MTNDPANAPTGLDDDDGNLDIGGSPGILNYGDGDDTDPVVGSQSNLPASSSSSCARPVPSSSASGFDAWFREFEHSRSSTLDDPDGFSDDPNLEGR